jgi:N-carbamoylputrescine amidase
MTGALTDKQRVTVGLVQHACPPPPPQDPRTLKPADFTEFKRRNLATAKRLIREAAGRGAQVVATQELFDGPYFPQIEHESQFGWAEPIPGPTTQYLAALAKELGIYLMASLFEKRTAGLYHNTSVMLDPSGAMIGKYRKMHIPDDPRFFEKFYFAPGDAPPPEHLSPHASRMNYAQMQEAVGWQVQDTQYARTGMLVCWDQWYPEAARLTALKGAEILFYPTAIGWYKHEDPVERPLQREAWITMQRSHAIANGVYVCAINRIGTEHELTFWGSSFIAGPGGEILTQAPQDEEAVLVAELDLRRIEAVRRGWPFLRDRRIDAYGDLLRRMNDRS